MTDESRFCPDCGAGYAPEDNYCRQCGMFVAALRTLPVASAPAARAVESVRPGLPVPVKKAATAIAVGTALQVGVGLAGKYMARQAAKQALSAVKPGRREPKAEVTTSTAEDPADGAASVSEMLLIRRVWLRRD